jgi:CPA1 family monovalent cation:H+ antiporter
VGGRAALLSLARVVTMLHPLPPATARLDDELATPTQRAGDCEHLRSAPRVIKARTPEGCEECLRDGTRWVHLRLCLSCGHVGCCDSSPQKHATAHYRDTAHPVMRSIEPGEAWRWCYPDELLG